MTQEERLQYCMICKNRKMDMQKGTICKLTGEVPDFDGQCCNIDTDAPETLEQVRFEQSPANEIAKLTEKLLFKQKKSAEETHDILMAKGLCAYDADYVISIIMQYREEKRTAGGKNMLYGALWCIGGLLVTFLTYSAASDGGTYVVAWGAVIFGVIQFFKGMFQRFS